MIVQLCCTVLQGFDNRYEAVTKNITRTQLDPIDNCLRPLKKK